MPTTRQKAQPQSITIRYGSSSSSSSSSSSESSSESDSEPIRAERRRVVKDQQKASTTRIVVDRSTPLRIDRDEMIWQRRNSSLKPASAASSSSSSNGLDLGHFSAARFSDWGGTGLSEVSQEQRHELAKHKAALKMKAAWSDIVHRHEQLPERAASTSSSSTSDLSRRTRTTKPYYNLHMGRSRAIPEEEDDIIDLETMEIVQDRGILRNIKNGGFAIERDTKKTLKGLVGENEDDFGEEADGADDESEDELAESNDLTGQPSVTYLDEKRKRLAQAEHLRDFMRMETMARQSRDQSMNHVNDREWTEALKKIDAIAGGNEVLDPLPEPSTSQLRKAPNNDEDDDDFEAFVEDRLPKRIENDLIRRRKSMSEVPQLPSPRPRARSSTPLMNKSRMSLPPTLIATGLTPSSNSPRVRTPSIPATLVKDRLKFVRQAAELDPSRHPFPSPPSLSASSASSSMSGLKNSLSRVRLTSISPLASRPVITSSTTLSHAGPKASTSAAKRATSEMPDVFGSNKHQSTSARSAKTPSTRSIPSSSSHPSLSRLAREHDTTRRRHSFSLSIPDRELNAVASSSKATIFEASSRPTNYTLPSPPKVRPSLPSPRPSSPMLQSSPIKAIVFPQPHSVQHRNKQHPRLPLSPSPSPDPITPVLRRSPLKRRREGSVASVVGGSKNKILPLSSVSPRSVRAASAREQSPEIIEESEDELSLPIEATTPKAPINRAVSIKPFVQAKEHDPGSMHHDLAPIFEESENEEMGLPRSTGLATPPNSKGAARIVESPSTVKLKRSNSVSPRKRIGSPKKSISSPRTFKREGTVVMSLEEMGWVGHVSIGGGTRSTPKEGFEEIVLSEDELMLEDIKPDVVLPSPKRDAGSPSRTRRQKLMDLKEGKGNEILPSPVLDDMSEDELDCL